MDDLLETLSGLLNDVSEYVRSHREQFRDAEKWLFELRKANPRLGHFIHAWTTATAARNSKRILFLCFMLYGDLRPDDFTHLSAKYIRVFTEGGWGESFQSKFCSSLLAGDESKDLETCGMIAAAMEECRSQSDQMPPRKPMKEPGKECRIAYQLTRIQGLKQEEAAKMMTQEGYKAPKGGEIKSYHVSRWVSDWAKWLEFHGLPVERSAPRAGRTITNHDVIEQGARTDGRKPKKRGF